MLSITVHLPLLAGRIAMSIWSDAGAFLSWMVRLEGGAFALVSTADVFCLSCSASVFISLLFLMPDSMTRMRSTAGNSSKI